MWSYLRVRRGSRRNSQWIWTAVVEWENGSRSVDFEVGDRSEKTFLRLCGRLPRTETYYSDAYHVYRWLPRHRHKIGKGGPVNRNEGIHSVLRDKLYRLHRHTKGYTKSIWMLRASIAMVCLQQRWV